MEYGITGADMRQESIAKALAFSSAFHQAGNIDDIQKSRNFTAISQSTKNG